MKFVSDRIVFPERESGGQYRLQVPSYHRSAVGIFPGNRLFFLHVPNTNDVIATPIDPQLWGDLWRLEVMVSDVPGAARSIVETLTKNNVNILIQEGLSDYGYDRKLAHRLFMVLDLSKYYSEIDSTSDHRNSVTRSGLRPNHLMTALLSESIDYVQTTAAEDSWNFSLERMEFFFRNKEYRSEAEVTNLSGKNLLVDEALVRSRVFLDDPPERLACHLISDSEEKYIKVRFLLPERQYVLLRIEHKEEVGAIYAFMNALKEHEVNIENSYSRLTSISRFAIWHAFCELPASVGEEQFRDLLQRIDSESSVDSFTVRSHYGLDFSIDSAVLGSELNKFRPTAPTGAARHDGSLEAATQPHAPSTIEARLALQPFYAGQAWHPERRSVFVAMPYDQQYEVFYREHIKDVIGQVGLDALRFDERSLKPNETMDHGIRRAIAVSRFVVADVSGHNPNVLYEVGLAHAIGKPVLLISERREMDVDLVFDLQNYLHVFYSPYDLTAFDDSFRTRLKDLLQALDHDS